MHRARRVGLPGLDENFEAIYLDDQDVEQRVPWGWLPEVVDELERPVRSFPSYRGQRNFPGWYWSATIGRRVGFESWVEEEPLKILNRRDPSKPPVPVRLLGRQEPDPIVIDHQQSTYVDPRTTTVTRKKEPRSAATPRHHPPQVP